jgi:hypothetical protein
MYSISIDCVAITILEKYQDKYFKVLRQSWIPSTEILKSQDLHNQITPGSNTRLSLIFKSKYESKNSKEEKNNVIWTAGRTW